MQEHEWKVFRELRPVALDRLCQRILQELQELAADPTRSYHDRYLQIFSLIQERNDDVARGFDDARRSTANLHLGIIRSMNLVTDEELARFSPETRQVTDFLAGKT